MFDVETTRINGVIHYRDHKSGKWLPLKGGFCHTNYRSDITSSYPVVLLEKLAKKR